MTDQRVESGDGEHLFALLAQLARRATDGQLVVAAAIGIVAAALLALVRPAWWLAALPLLSLGSFGLWGIADRTAAERTTRLGPSFPGHRGLGALRLVAAGVGTLAAVATLLVVVARVIGTWTL